jgi:hypothetical protein
LIADQAALAQASPDGGHQVGALPCLLYPGGEDVDVQGHTAQLQLTWESLQREEVPIYKAALEAQVLFVRLDILRKRSRGVELIEVKESYGPSTDVDLRGEGSASPPAAWLPRPPHH